MDGLRLMEEYGKRYSDVDFIVLTAYGTIESAIQSMKMGALDYILKPLREPEEIRTVIRRAFERRRLLDENRALKSEALKGLPPLEIVFAGMEDVLEDLKAVATADTTVLLTGETGTGKGVIARVIHQLSERKGAFVEVNCASVPEHLLESEFFGHEKGAFTGATSTKKGKFEIASEGTIFLDEIGEMDRPLQAKLLRVLQDGTFERLGSNATLKTDARIVCATNKDLQQEVSEGRFREDLYFRLNVFPVRLKPLRERREAIPAIASYLVSAVSRRLGKPDLEISERDMERLASYHWPGNVRELQNVIERAVILSRGGVLDLSRIELTTEGPSGTFTGSLREVEKKAIQEALSRFGGNRRKTAEALGISLRTLQYKIKEYGLI
jgi:DNA-binding NtrC family response regulator